MGVLRNHAPVLSALVEGVIEIEPVDGERIFGAVDGGFVSVANNRVSILSQYAALSHEINVEEARAELEAAESEPEGDEADARAKRAAARIRAVDRAS
jgi:F-type H+-transporting ATPase subunit epsilon